MLQFLYKVIKYMLRIDQSKLYVLLISIKKKHAFMVVARTLTDICTATIIENIMLAYRLAVIFNLILFSYK